MEWTEKYATGIPQLDDQHRTLFRMTSDFRLALDEGKGDRVYGNLLQSLDLYARSHFRFEEGCMVKYACPALDSNRAAHRNFVDALSRYQKKFSTSGFTPTDGRDLVDHLDTWLDTHIGNLDTQLQKAVEAAG
ncbi:MAG TPA: hemerythrin family protein [Candidatus Polarisedimenticolia bacterium]|nr:hemerythrin family protein [Candidatus Polarisedimenticolia bacterium]